MICATARRHNLGQIKPTPLSLGEARSPQLEASQQLHDANCTFCQEKSRLKKSISVSLKFPLSVTMQ